MVPRRKYHLIHPLTLGALSAKRPVAGGGPSLFNGTKFLSHFDGTNGSTTFTDVTGKTITPGGGTTISTTEKMFGTASAFFGTGTTRYLSVASTVDFGFGTGDFQVECWVWLDFLSQCCVFDFNPPSTDGAFPRLFIETDGKVMYHVSGVARITSTTGQGFSGRTDQWIHVALCRVSGTTRVFIGGVQGGSGWADSTNYGTAALLIGKQSWNNAFYQGYIDEFRVKKGVGDYASAFTPSVTAFPDS